MKLNVLTLSAIGFLSLSLTGCPPKAEVKKEETQTTEEAKPTDEPSLRGKDYQSVAEIGAITFDLDQSTLRADARDTLGKNYEVLKSHQDWEVLVEGHCDERGTTEYNLGLGQKRAAAVRSYYMTLGMKGTKIATISYGKENPVCTDHTEGCWSQNRRGVTKVRALEQK